MLAGVLAQYNLCRNVYDREVAMERRALAAEEKHLAVAEDSEKYGKKQFSF